MDEDLEVMSREQLIVEARRLRAGIRAHRDSSGDALCWHHPALWGCLPEKTDPLPTVPTWPEFRPAARRRSGGLYRERWALVGSMGGDRGRALPNLEVRDMSNQRLANLCVALADAAAPRCATLSCRGRQTTGTTDRPHRGRRRRRVRRSRSES